MSSSPPNSVDLDKPVKKRLGRRCAFCGVYDSKTTNKRFYGFPPNEDRCKAWAEASKLPYLCKVDYHAIRHYHVCSDHFVDKDFTSNTKNRLKPNACPRSLDELPVNIPEIRELLKSKLIGNSCESDTQDQTIVQNGEGSRVVETQQSANGALNLFSFIREINSKLFSNVPESDSLDPNILKNSEGSRVVETQQNDDGAVNVPSIREQLKSKLTKNTSESKFLKF